jgi:hypothetical protein
MTRRGRIINREKALKEKEKEKEKKKKKKTKKKS